MADRKKILWLVSWYPNKYDAFDGDFIQRHARAASLYNDIYVLFVKASDKQTTNEEVISQNDSLIEQIIYIPKKHGLHQKIGNLRRWQKVYKEQVSTILKRESPVFIHIHIPWKAGLIALWATKKFNIPYLITEHWGIYNSIVEDNIHTKPFLTKALIKQIYKKALGFVSVSNYVGRGVNETLVKKTFTVIPNVVDTNLFYPAIEKYNQFTFLHVSNMVPLKNVKGILAAFKKFTDDIDDNVKLVLVGNKDIRLASFAQTLGLPITSYSFRGEIPYEEVAAEMQRSHVLILNSNIENSPCVIGEAHCCGLPVIATKVGGIPELLNNENGLLIPPQNDAALVNAMKKVYQDYSRYQVESIALTAQEKFSMQTIGKAFSALYSSFD